MSARLPFESRSDHTVPPAISLASIAPKRKMRSTLAMVSAAFLGLAALVLTPHWASSNDAPAHVAATRVARSASASAIELPAAATAVVVEAPAAFTALAPAALAAPVARVAVAVASSALDAKHVAPPHKADKATVASASPARSGVHGGLSNPGF